MINLKGKQLPGLLFSGFGVLFLIWGLNSLHSIFAQEYKDATSAILSRHRTLEQYAVQAFKQSLQQQLAVAKVNLNQVLRDPLVENSNILYFNKKGQILPRPSVYSSTPTGSQNAMSLYDELMARDPIDLANQSSDPWELLLDALSRFKLAVESNDANNIRWEFRVVSDRRSTKPVPPQRDIPYMLALLDYLVSFTNPEKSLVTNIIRTGSIIDQERGSYGLQRALLANRNLFSREEFTTLSNKVLLIAKKFDIPHEDFIEQIQIENKLLDIDTDTSTPALHWFSHKEQWYVEPHAISELIGTTVNSQDIISSIELTMKTIGLLEQADTVELSTIPQKRLDLEELILAVKSSGLNQRLKAANKRYWLKTFLLFAVALLVLSIAALVLLILYRKQKYLALKSEFIATVSHELKTPLASARVLAETLMRKTAGFHPAKDYPKRIVNSIDSMTLLVDNILSFNRLTKDSWKLRRSNVNVEEVVASLKHEFSQYTNHPLTIETRNPDNLELLADQELIQMLLRNLVSNACKYNDNDNIQIKLELKMETPDLTCVYFSDNGIGIESQNQNSIFDEFSRVIDDNKTVSGTGLGLAICRKILHLHQGEISVHTSSRNGTTFKLTFPLGSNAGPNQTAEVPS